MTMTNNEFYDKVVELRKAQRDFYQVQTSQALSRKTKLEREIDNEIRAREYTAPKPAPTKQGNLFE